MPVTSLHVFDLPLHSVPVTLYVVCMDAGKLSSVDWFQFFLLLQALNKLEVLLPRQPVEHTTKRAQSTDLFLGLCL